MLPCAGNRELLRQLYHHAPDTGSSRLPARTPAVEILAEETETTIQQGTSS